MSEYQNVEKPFLDQLAALGWQVIDQGAGFPTDPAKSLRPDFKTVLLKDAFNQGVRNINGEGFLYLGRTYRLKLVAGQSVPLTLKDGYFCLRADHGSPAAAFREFYRQKGRRRIGQRVAFFQGRMGVHPRAVRIIELKNRWASCSHDGNLNFHWKCMMAPPQVLDYIVVHELAHLIHPDHTQAFWNTVDKVLPTYQERKAWLRINGAGMDL